MGKKEYASKCAFCDVRANFGFPKTKVKKYCSAHRKPGTINLNNGCILCNMNFISGYKLCGDCKLITNLEDAFVLKYIKFHYTRLNNPDDFKLFIVVNSKSSMEYDPEEKLRLLKQTFPDNKIILIIVNFNMQPYYDAKNGTLKTHMIMKLGSDLKVIMNKIRDIHNQAVISFEKSNLFYV